MVFPRIHPAAPPALLAMLLAAGCSPATLRAAPAAVPARPAAVAAVAAAATAPAPVRSVSTATASATSVASDLRARLDAYIAQPRFAQARWGIDVIDLADGHTLYAHAADKLFVPASNAKLFTAALALDTLGSDHRFTTTLAASARPDARGVLRGDLLLIGGGDQTLGSDSAGATSGDWAATFAAALAARGVTRITGDLIADATRYAGPPFGAGWEAADLQSDFAPPVSALSVQDNVMQVQIARRDGRCCRVEVEPAAAGVSVVNRSVDRTPGDDASLGLYRPPGRATLYVTGSLPAGVDTRRYVLSQPDPAATAGRLLRDAIERGGIAFDGEVRALHWPQTDGVLADPRRLVLAQVESPPLAAIVRHTLKHSDNLYAQQLLLQVGVAAARRGVCADRSEPPHSTQGWGLCALRAFLVRVGIPPGEASFEEGSGLSRKDLVSPRAFTALLAWARRQAWAGALLDALPQAGVDGTLADRFRDLPAGADLRAKTGTLAHIYTLSGYLTDAAGTPLAFSLMLNNEQRTLDAQGRPLPPSPVADLDAVARMLAEFGSDDRSGRAPRP